MLFNSIVQPDLAQAAQGLLILASAQIACNLQLPFYRSPGQYEGQHQSIAAVTYFSRLG